MTHSITVRRATTVNGRLALVIVSAAIWAGCVGQSAVGSSASWSAAYSPSGAQGPTPTPAPSATASTAPVSTDYCGSATISIDYAPYTTATLVGYGWDFVVASVEGFEPAIFNTPDGSPWPGFPEWPRRPNPVDPLIYTPVNVSIDRTISGPLRRGPGQFLVEGGSIGCYTMWVDDVPRVVRGSRYVFILSEALDGEGQPLPLPKARFAWPVNDGGTVITVDGPTSIDELAEIVMNAAASGDIPAR